MCHLPKIENGASVGLLRYLLAQRAANIYPIFQVLRRHAVRIWRLTTSAGEIVGALVEGGQSLYPFVPDTWLLADDDLGCRLLLEYAIAKGLSGTISLPRRYNAIAIELGLPCVEESHFISPAFVFPNEAPLMTLLPLTRQALKRLAIGPRVQRLLGDIELLPPESWYFGAIVNMQVIAIIETGVATPDAVAVQQMYVEPEWRRRHVATYLLTALCNCATMSGRRVTYLTTSGNLAALAMLQRMGFQLIDERVTASLDGSRIAS